MVLSKLVTRDEPVRVPKLIVFSRLPEAMYWLLPFCTLAMTCPP